MEIVKDFRLGVHSTQRAWRVPGRRDGRRVARWAMALVLLSPSLAAAQGPPGVTDVQIGSPVVGDTFERGERIEVTVTFSAAVDVSGTPQLALGIGTQTRQASYASGTGTASLVFGYVVVQADADGLSIGPDAAGPPGRGLQGVERERRVAAPARSGPGRALVLARAVVGHRRRCPDPLADARPARPRPAGHGHRPGRRRRRSGLDPGPAGDGAGLGRGPARRRPGQAVRPLEP